MTPALLKRLVIDPMLSAMGQPYDRPEAKKLLSTIALQESGLIHREQYPSGIAHSFWQAERGGGVAGVCAHPATKAMMREWSTALCVPFNVNAIYEAITYNDQLACVLARLLLYSDPNPLPSLNDPDGGWRYYIRCWRPGKPRPDEWNSNWHEAVA